MAPLSFDTQSYNPILAENKLRVETVAATPLAGSSIIISDPKFNTNDKTNKGLAGALEVYGRHYLASQSGIPGEGELVPDILSRLRGEDENVTRMTVLALKDQRDKVVGVAFVETYETGPLPGKDGQPDQPGGLAHLLTYAAVEAPHEKTAVNAAFHTAVLDEIVKIDNELGYPKNSILVTEVNATRDFEGKRYANSDGLNPDAEFEIKTGAPREFREAYVFGGNESIISLSGQHNTSQALGLNYAVPNLGGEEDQKIPAGIKSAGDLAPFLINEHIAKGDAEVLFLTGESPYHMGLNSRDLAMHQAFQLGLNVSVAQGNHGIESKDLIIEALGHSSNKDFGTMMSQYDQTIAALKQTEVGTKPPTSISAGATQAEDVGREPPQQQVQK